MKSDCRYRVERQDRGLSADVLASLDFDRQQEWVEHIRACSSCRRAVVAGDPILVFSLLEPDPLDEVQVAEMQAAVRTLRRSRVIEAGDKSRPSGERKTTMVAASLLCALALLPLSGERRLEDAGQPPVYVVSEERLRAQSGWLQWVEDRTATPVIEGLNRPGARVYQLTEEDLAVVMIVDETLDL